MMKRYVLYGISIVVILATTLLLAFSPAQKQNGHQKVSLGMAKLVDMEESYIAGGEITLTVLISVIDTVNPEEKSYPLQLYVSSSYGSSLLDMSSKDGMTYFQIPPVFTKKSGVVQWRLIHAKKVFDEGSFMITPNSNKKAVVESYVGPPSIIAGGNDFTMLVTAATDTYDNLLPNNTEITIKHYQDGVETKSQYPTEDRIAWKRVFSSETTGKITFAATHKTDASKELMVEVLPNSPSNFSMEAKRVHTYADGNQIVTFSTSQIVDAYNNIVADGTLVTFSILSSEGTQSRTSGTTINGVAKGQLLHPNSPTQWQIKALVDGMAESNVLELAFNPFLLEFDVNYSETNHSITVGPLTSFMGQLVPDGAEVTLTQTELGIEETKFSFNGMVTFPILENYGDVATPTFTIEALGVSQSINLTKE